MKSPIKWAGGKSRILPQILPFFPETYGQYWEPFLGGGSVFLALELKGPALLSDLNPHLINFWQCLQKDPESLHNQILELAERSSEAFYYEQRAAINAATETGTAAAARFFYLNKTGFSGLWRENKKGGMNTPWGGHRKFPQPSLEAFLAASVKLQYAEIQCYSFDQIQPQSGDLVYFDPPYRGTFTQYKGSGFGEAEQQKLRDLMLELHDRGVACIASNSEAARDLYSDPAFEIVDILAPRSFRTSKEKTAKEILVIC